MVLKKVKLNYFAAVPAASSENSPCFWKSYGKTGCINPAKGETEPI